MRRSPQFSSRLLPSWIRGRARRGGGSSMRRSTIMKHLLTGTGAEAGMWTSHTWR